MRSSHPVILITAIFFFISNTGGSTNMSIEAAAKKGLVKLLIKSKGGYTGTVIEMTVRNNTAQALYLQLEAGRRLDSQTQAQQDILVTQAQEIVVSAKQSKLLDVKGMCCQAHNSAPRPGALYTVGTMADSNLIRLANYIDKNKYYHDYTAQQSVWVISDDNSLGSVTGDHKEMVKGLREYVSKITGKVIPPYEVRYGNGNDLDLLGHPTRIDGTFEYTLPVNGHATIAIYNEAGTLVQVLFEDLSHERGEYKLYYTFRTRELPDGTYYAKLKLGGMLQKEEKIVI
jgi:hypothetical protein